MLITFFEGIIYILTSIWLLDIFNLFKRINSNSRRIMAASITIIFGIASYFALYIPTIVMVFLQIAVMFTIIKLLFQTSLRNIVLYVIVFMLLHSLHSEILTTTITIFNKIYKLDIYEDLGLANTIIILIAIIILSLPIKRFTILGSNKLGKKNLIILICMLICNSYVVIRCGDFVLEATSYKEFNSRAGYYFTICIMLILEVIMTIYLASSRALYKDREAMAQRYLDSQKQHYEYLSQKEIKTRRFRHDLSNHMTLLAQLCKKGDIASIEKYLDEINIRISEFGSKINTHNEIADAIFNRYYDQCRNEGIELKVEGHFPNECRISILDLCTILSNLLDNSIRAEKESQGNEILISVRNTDDNKIFLLAENDYKEKPQSVNGIIQTTKKNSLEHGYGLENIKECVRKYNGCTNITSEDSKFRVWICLDN